MKNIDNSKAQQSNKPSKLSSQIPGDLGNLCKHILDQLPICTIVYDSQGKIIFRNKATKLIGGYDDEQLIGLSREDYLKLLEIKPGIVKKNVYPKYEMENFKDGIFGLAETIVLTRNGNAKNLLLTGDFIYGDDDELIGACGCAVDVSDYVKKYKQAEETLLAALKESQQQREEISALLESTRTVLKYRNYRETAKEIFNTCKNVIGSTSGYVALLSSDETQNEVLILDPGKYACTVDPSMPMPIRGLREEAYRTGKVVYHNEFNTSKWSALLPGGHLTLYNVLFAPLIINDKTLGLIGLANKPGGFTEHDARMASAFGEYAAIALYNNRILESLKKKEEFFQKAFNAGPSLMLVYNFNDSRIIDINENLLNLLGYNREEVIGHTTLELDLWVNPAERELIRQLAITRGNVNNQQILLRKKSGEIITALYSAETININNNIVLLASINDITRNKQMERNLARLERLNLIGQMAAGIGHEIRNPMTTVRGFLQMLGAREECARQKEYFDLMIEELDRANSIISEFLSLARDKPVYLERTNLNSIVKTLFPLMMADAMASDMDIQMELQDIPELLLDQKEIRQLLLNLFRNGLEAMAPGGQLMIKTFLDGEEVVLAVVDQGKGIEPDILEKISTPFFTTKENGTGLGLAVCYSIASRNNATVKIETGPKGSAFYVRFKI